MYLNPSQIINNIKRSFNAYLESVLAHTTINFDEDPFETGELTSWYAVRYVGYSSESSGMGDLIDEDTNAEGRFHVLKCELSAWCRDDSQRVSLGEMIDNLVAISEAPSVALYNYADPENPVEIGTIQLKPSRGVSTPPWSGSAGGVLKSSGDIHAEGRMVGFVLEMNLTVLAEVD